MFSEEKIGKTIIVFQIEGQFNKADWFIVKNEKQEIVGKLLIKIEC